MRRDQLRRVPKEPEGQDSLEVSPYPGAPLWVKVFGAVVAAVAVAFVLLRFTIGMHHG